VVEDGVPVVGSSGGSGAGAQSATVKPLPALTPPVPTIVWGQGAAACQNPSAVPPAVVVGQQIAFTACFQAPAGTQVQSASWTPSLPPGAAVGGYNLTYDTSNIATSASVQPFTGSACSLTDQFCTYGPFYWVDQGNSRAFQFTYSLVGGGSNQATVAFNVGGVSGPSLSESIGTARMIQVGGIPVLQFGDPSGAPGIAFTANPPNPKSPAGSGQFAYYVPVQLITADTRTQLPYGDPTYTSDNPQVCTPKSLGLDNYYPLALATPNTTNDSPTTAIRETVGEKLRDFAATLYLMWDPALPTGCAPAYTTVTNNVGTPHKSTCDSIPVPLASIQWEIKACAINTLNPSAGVNLDGSKNGTPVSISCGQPNPNLPTTGTAIQPASSGSSYGYPQWGSAYSNEGSFYTSSGDVCP
jgi:hypothetical protein